MSEALVPPWVAQQRSSLLTQRGHAWLLQGPSGLGQYRLALELVRAWLCDAPGTNGAQGACGQCASCHAIEVHAHADLCLLMPEAMMLELGWPLSEKAQSEIDNKSRKPSKEIRVDAMRDAVEFSQRTSARGRGKAVLVYPADRMNHITANALLKTLEEPPGDVKFVLATGAAHQLLPTIRSRCMGHNMLWPDTAEATAWLQSHGVAAVDAPVLLAAAGGRPEDALQWSQAGRTAQSWSALPKAVAQGVLATFADWGPAQVVDALQKLCHDLLLLRVGATPRFFAPADLPAAPSGKLLTQWAKDLNATARVVEHPFNAGLLLESLVGRAQNVLNSRL
jgi:DNA polymerase-3 subunit delta'